MKWSAPVFMKGDFSNSVKSCHLFRYDCRLNYTLQFFTIHILFGRQHVLGKLPQIVSGNFIIAWVNLLAVAGAETTSDLGGSFPDHLSEMPRWSRVPRVVVIVRLYFIVPSSDNLVPSSIPHSQVFTIRSALFMQIASVSHRASVQHLTVKLTPLCWKTHRSVHFWAKTAMLPSHFNAGAPCLARYWLWLVRMLLMSLWERAWPSSKKRARATDKKTKE